MFFNFYPFPIINSILNTDKSSVFSIINDPKVISSSAKALCNEFCLKLNTRKPAPSSTWLPSSHETQPTVTLLSWLEKFSNSSKTLILSRLLVQIKTLLLYLRTFAFNYFQSSLTIAWKRNIFQFYGSFQLFALVSRILVNIHLHHSITPLTIFVSLVNTLSLWSIRR